MRGDGPVLGVAGLVSRAGAAYLTQSLRMPVEVVEIYVIDV